MSVPRPGPSSMRLTLSGLPICSQRHTVQTPIINHLDLSSSSVALRATVYKVRSFTLLPCHLVVATTLVVFFTDSAPSPAPSPALLGSQAVPPATGSTSSFTSRRIGVLGLVGLAIVLL
ncbi:unnamed protein product [Eruca vesicaria subsp. sativa]|uniref:Uncharacterized protein n=1 Tax=Eruca vesicaria subsp. sativa TaxID=29727 RepID=A0ABC8LQT4_ERUVS|nr:unnamed protein product [Eruca vesicaria subsp. sativa]